MLTVPIYIGSTTTLSVKVGKGGSGGSGSFGSASSGSTGGESCIGNFCAYGGKGGCGGCRGLDDDSCHYPNYAEHGGCSHTSSPFLCLKGILLIRDKSCYLYRVDGGTVNAVKDGSKGDDGLVIIYKLNE